MANDEIEKILVRRIVLEGFEPTVKEIGRLVDTKARDFKVRATDLMSEAQFMNNIYTRVMESDFIPRELRQQILDRLIRSIDETELAPLEEQTLEEIVSGDVSSARWPNMLIMAALASAVGTVLAIVPELGGRVGSDLWRLNDLLPLSVVTVTLSLEMISGIMVYFRIRDQQQEDTGKADRVLEYLAFEQQVVEAMEKLGAGITRASSMSRADRGYDFVVENKGKKILVEVKSWTRRVPPSVARLSVDRLREAIVSEDASYAVVVTQRRLTSKPRPIEGDRVKIMTLGEFQRHVAEDG